MMGSICWTYVFFGLEYKYKEVMDAKCYKNVNVWYQLYENQMD